MFRVIVAPISFVPSEEGTFSCQDVLLRWYNAVLTEIIGRIYIIILSSYNKKWRTIWRVETLFLV